MRATPLVTALLTAGLLPLAANAQLTGAAAAPVPLSSPWGLSLAPQLEEHVVPVGQSPARFVLGDEARGNIDKDVSVLGHGELRGAATFVKGDRLHYDMDTDVADAYGNVRLTNQGNTFTGPEAHMKLGATEGYMVSPAYHFNLTGGSGKAERIDVLDPERSVVAHGTYTGCACADDPAWYIRGSRFDFDTGTNSGTARNGVLFFQGVPIFASPYLSFPLNNDRRSGLLPPTMAVSSSAGVDISTPYYFNIAPDRDFTLTPRVMSQRGVQLGGTYRYLSPTYSGTTTVEYLPHDAIKKSERYAIFLQHAQNFGGGFGGYINYNRVSDSTYPEDLSSSNNLFITGTQLLYQQEAGLTYANGPWSVLARVQKWQTLPPSISPYERVPQLNVGYHKFDVGGFDYGAEADFTRFRVNTPDMPEGQRVYLNPYVSYPIIRPDYFFVPKVQYHLAAYDLSAQGTGITGVTGSRRQSVAIPTTSVDTGLIFERPVRLFGQDYIQTLEPRLYYVYTPYRDQSHIPIFDTAESDFGLAEIFTENTYVGNDRVADANRLTAGITTRFINPTTGDERARFVFAQQYYFTDQRTVIPGQPLAQATHSDLILGASLKLGQGFASETAIQYNADNNQLVRSNIGFGWSPADRKVLNMAYRYTRASTTLFNQPISQAVMSAQWPLMRRLYAVGRLNFDIRSHRLVDGLLGFQYDADCWAFGVALQRYANGIEAGGRNATGSRILAQLELKGFSHIDNGLVQQFRASVPGYMPPPPGAPPLSRFSQYQ